LPRNIKVTDLPVTPLDNRVPHQGSVLLDKTVSVSEIVKQPNLIKRLIILITTKIASI
jgi:hypothetical protein